MNTRLLLPTLLAFFALHASVSYAGTATALVTREPAIDCSSAAVGSSAPCGTIKLLGSGGTGSPVTLANPYFTVTGNTSEFVLTLATSGDACYAGQILAPNAKCTVGTLEFRPTATGNRPQFHFVARTTVIPDGGFGSITWGGAGYTYSWQIGAWPGCGGGTGTWSYSPWSPISGCGAVTQTRSASCNPDALSAAQVRTVSCTRNDGVTVADSLCPGARPADTQSCTPTSGFSCGTQAALSQSTQLTDTCAYEWLPGPWSASSNTCSASATQTRTVSCRRSDGTTVADASCNAGTRPAVSQTVGDFSGCTYTWQPGGWNACVGGAGTWSYTPWLPASGCGTVSQTRTAACNADADSATQDRSVTCLRSDGTPVADSSCMGPKPAITQTCTPSSGFSCGPEAGTSQSVLLTDICTYSWQIEAWSSWSSQCSESATRTREVRCLRADGVFVADTSCTAARAPSSETSGVFTGCTYSWISGGFGECSGGSARWVAGQWLPATGCGATEQTRTLTCTVDANSGSRTQSSVCRRSDGVTVVDSNCDVSLQPVSMESCTPSVADCGVAPTSGRSFVLASACPSANESSYRGCIPDPASGKYCVFTPL